MTLPKLTDLQARVLGAVTPEWADIDAVARACGWGGEGCRRPMCGLWLVACALQRRGLIEMQAGTDHVRRIGGAK